MKSTFFEWRCNKVTEYFSSRKEVSMPQRIAYKCLISWIGNASLAVICFLFANTVSKMMKQRFKSSRENFSPLLNKSRSCRACWIQVKKIHQLTIERSALKGSFRFRVLSFPGFRENSCFSAASFLIESANVRLTCLIVTHLTPCSFVSQWTLPNYKGLFAYFGKQRGRTFLSFCQVLCKKNPPTRFFYPHRRWVG